jgi:hypothetical protein
MAPLAPVTPRITLLPRDDSEGSIKGMLVSVFREVKKVCACLAPDILINEGMGGEIDS